MSTSPLPARRGNSSLAIGWALLILACSGKRAGTPAPIDEVVARLDSLRLVAQARALSDDSLAGRANGSAGQLAARHYILRQLRSAGVQAISGDNFEQTLPLMRVQLDSTSHIAVRSLSGSRQFGPSAFHHYSGSEASFRSFAGRLLYVGRGESALRLLQAEDSLPGVVLVLEAGGGMIDSIGKMLTARGGSGLLVAFRSEPGYNRYRNARGRTRWFLPEKVRGSGGRDLPVLALAPSLTETLGLPDVADSARLAAPRELKRTVEVSIASSLTPVDAANIIAMVPGSESTAESSAVMFVAHYDHIGYGDAVQGDSLYNGFMDDAVGVSVLLETARVLAASRPRHPVFFLFTAGEEEGLLGSSYFAAHPLVPLTRIGAVFTIDLPAPLAPPRSWYLETSSEPLVDRVRDLLSARGWQVTALPLQQSSDHWTFAQYGVPSALVVPGEGWEGVTAGEEAELIERWWKPHTPKDEWSPGFPAAGLLRVAELAVRLSHFEAVRP